MSLQASVPARNEQLGTGIPIEAIPQVFGVCWGFLALLGGGYLIFLGTLVQAQETPASQSSVDINLLTKAIARFAESERYPTQLTLLVEGRGR